MLSPTQEKPAIDCAKWCRGHEIKFHYVHLYVRKTNDLLYY